MSLMIVPPVGVPPPLRTGVRDRNTTGIIGEEPVTVELQPSW